MSYVLPLGGTKSYGRKTETANTVITRLIEPRLGMFTHLSSLWYECSTTAHALTVMRPLNRTTSSASAAASQAVINFTADPGDYSTAQNGQTVRTADNVMAAGDYVVYQCADNSYVLDTIASVATLAVTMTTNLPTAGILSGASIWWFGVHGDTNPNDAQAHPKFTLPASVVTYLDDTTGLGGWIGTFPGILPNMTGKNEPLLLYVDNATAQGTLHRTTALYSKVG